MMMDLAVKVTALLGAAWVVAFLLRGRAASTRHAVWIGLMAAALVLPVFAALVPPVELAWLPADPSGISQPQQAGGRTLVALPQGRVERSAPGAFVSSVTPATIAGAPRAFTLTVRQALLGAWFVVALFLLLRLIAAHAQARRVLAACAAPSDALAASVASVAAELGVSAPPVRVAKTGIMPAVIGILRPSIVLPSEAESWSAERLRVVLLHECAHVRRRDALLQVIASVATAAYWWHPLSWLAARRIVRERELACDDLVIASGTPGTTYAEHLLDIARSMRQSNQPSLATLAMARPSELEGRLIALLEERPRDTRPARALAIGVALALAAVSAVAPLKLVARAVMSDTATGTSQAAPAVQLEEAPRAKPDVQTDHTEPVPQPAPQAQKMPSPAPSVNPAFASILLKAAHDEDDDIRMVALASLGRSTSADATAALVAALQDSRDDIRALALLQLIDREGVVLQPHVMKALQDVSDDVRRAAVMALTRIDIPERQALLLEAAGDASDDVRTMATLGLGREEGSAVDEMLVKLSSDASPDVRRAAILAIAGRSGRGIAPGIEGGIAAGIAGGVAGGIAEGIAGGIAGALEARLGKPVRKQ